jgi:hypothetical protein
MPSTVEGMGVVIDEAWSMGHVLPCCNVEAHGDTQWVHSNADLEPTLGLLRCVWREQLTHGAV